MGSSLPSRRVDNAELAEQLGRSAEEIERRTGVRSRYYAEAGQGPSDLAQLAAAEAFREAGCGAQDVELVIFATMTPDVTFPGSGCYLQHKLGCGTTGALDLRAHCAGFLFALDVADSFVQAGAYRTVLIAAADVHSSGLDFTPRGADVTPLFGDGAVVALLGPGEPGVAKTILHTDATHFERFWCEFPSSRRLPVRVLPEDFAAATFYPVLDSAAVRRDGSRQIGEAVAELLDQTGTEKAAVSHFFLQHVYRETGLEAARSLGVSDRATVGGLEEGHIASASLALSLCRARGQGHVKAGDLVCLATAGAGENYAASLVRM